MGRFSALLKLYRSKSYWIHSVVLISSTILIPLVIILLTIYNISRNITKTEIQNANSNTLSSLSRTIDSHLGIANVICSYLLNRSGIVEESSIAQSPVKFDYDMVTASNAVVEQIRQITSITGFSGKITLIDSRVGRYYSSDGESGSFIEKSNLFPSEVLFQKPDWKEAVFFDQSTALVYCEGFGEIYVLVQIPSSSIYSMIERTLTRPYQVRISNSEGQCIYESGSLVSDAELLREENVVREQYVQTVDVSALTELEYVLIRPVENYNSGYTYLKNWILLLLLFSSILVLLLSVFVTRRIYKPIGAIIELVKISNERSEWQTPVSTKDLDEIQYITQGLEQQLIHSEQIQRQLKQKILDLKKAQSLALQSQIHSHFLFNYLETMNWSSMLQLGESNSISRMITLLSKLLRLSLDNTRTLIPIEEELEHIHLYLDSQSFRYGEQFSTVWEVERHTLSCKILKLTLQPIVENIFSHAIKGSKEKIQITIRCFFSDSCLTIEIKDTGTGIPPEELAQLNYRIRNSSREFKEHIGLVNVAKRLSLLFDTPEPLTVESEYGSYTRVRVRIPQIGEGPSA